MKYSEWKIPVYLSLSKYNAAHVKHKKQKKTNF